VWAYHRQRRPRAAHLRSVARFRRWWTPTLAAVASARCDRGPSTSSDRLVDVTGYSGTPLAAKLGIRPDSTLMILGAPSEISFELPAGVVIRRRARGAADVVVSFHARVTTLPHRVESLSKLVFPAGGLWIAWPKKASGIESDITDHLVREEALRLGLVDNKVCAIDETWTALRLVWRRENR